MFVLVECLEDEASRTIASILRREHRFEPVAGRRFEGRPVEASEGLAGVALVTIEHLHLHAATLDARLHAHEVEAAEIVFLSKHRSAAGTPALTVHPLGNWSEAKLGGEPGRFTPVPAARMTQALRNLKAARDEAGYESQVTFEVTHHGPLLATPAFFIELGSGPDAWSDERGARCVAQAIVRTYAEPTPKWPVMIGLGGGHYAPRFTEAALARRVHYGHLWPSHHMSPGMEWASLVRHVVEATPGVAGIHVQDGVVPPELRTPLLGAFGAASLAQVSSRDWAAL